MRVILKRDTKRIKSGWSSRSATLRLTAHGFSEEVADRNLGRIVRLFLEPFVREGDLERQLDIIPIRYERDDSPLEVTFEEE